MLEHNWMSAAELKPAFWWEKDSQEAQRKVWRINEQFTILSLLQLHNFLRKTCLLPGFYCDATHQPFLINQFIPNWWSSLNSHKRSYAVIKIINRENMARKHRENFASSISALSAWSQKQNIPKSESERGKVFHVSFPFRIWLLCVITQSKSVPISLTSHVWATAGGLCKQLFPICLSDKSIKMNGSDNIRRKSNSNLAFIRGRRKSSSTGICFLSPL